MILLWHSHYCCHHHNKLVINLWLTLIRKTTRAVKMTGRNGTSEEQTANCTLKSLPLLSKPWLSNKLLSTLFVCLFIKQFPILDPSSSLSILPSFHPSFFPSFLLYVLPFFPLFLPPSLKYSCIHPSPSILPFFLPSFRSSFLSSFLPSFHPSLPPFTHPLFIHLFIFHFRVSLIRPFIAVCLSNCNVHYIFRICFEKLNLLLIAIEIMKLDGEKTWV